MMKLFNPRIILLVATVMVLLSATRAGSPTEQVHRSIITCVCLFLLYVVVFLVPLRKAVPASRLAGMAASLLAAWAATALALIADALPIVSDDQLHHPINMARLAFVVAAGIAFYLFFDMAVRGYEARSEMDVTGRRPD